MNYKFRWEGREDSESGIAFFNYNDKEIAIPMENLFTARSIDHLIRNVYNNGKRNGIETLIAEIHAASDVINYNIVDF